MFNLLADLKFFTSNVWKLLISRYEYEKLRMRQNPMFQPRAQVGGRSMPAWFAATLVNQSRVAGPSPPPPPLPSEPPPEESDYEEIDHLPKNTMKKAGSRRTCSLCGNPNPAVSCEMCDNQIFCGSCNDMYHRHPKRQHHSRKILEPLDNRPPLPPKTPA
ncbi:E3 ubiquitin-protein ligase RNF31 [Orchesella cincta]|uniref:E3 ubiquitin-protein ligase RNF31 n=1 Tax=Orchesella cincta TaxID=48709 RepID=A0A1D2MLQ7_ORCCI|nr:E3 ubiquitin-protein ligase RNF31 [Orchesella cincta]